MPITISTVSPVIQSGNDVQMLPSGTMLDANGDPLVACLRENSFIFEDFVSGSAAGSTVVTGVAANSGTVANGTSTTVANGVVRLSSAASSNAQAAVRYNPSGIILGGMSVIAEWRVNLSALSTALEEYALRVGLGDSTTTEHTDGIYVTYDRAATGDFWVAKTASNGSVTPVVSAVVPVAGSWARIRVTVNAAATSASCYVDGVLLATIATTIPSGAGRGTGAVCALIKSVGTTAVNVDVDYYWQHMTFTTVR